jgi:hypothetical protein
MIIIIIRRRRRRRRRRRNIYNAQVIKVRREKVVEDALGCAGDLGDAHWRQEWQVYSNQHFFRNYYLNDLSFFCDNFFLSLLHDKKCKTVMIIMK